MKKSVQFWAIAVFTVGMIALPQAAFANPVVTGIAKKIAKEAAEKAVRETAEKTAKATAELAAKELAEQVARGQVDKALREAVEKAMKERLEVNIKHYALEAANRNTILTDGLKGELRKRAIDDTDKLLTESLRSRSLSLGSANAAAKIPRTGGRWNGAAGNSEWFPDINRIPPPSKNPHGQNFNGLVRGNINKNYSDIGLSNTETARLQNNLSQLADGRKGIMFLNNEPDFSPFSVATETLQKHRVGRYGTQGTFSEADRALARRLGVPETKVRQWKNDNQYVWHERLDGRTLDLVSHDINGNISHTGGISVNRQLAANY